MIKVTSILSSKFVPEQDESLKRVMLEIITEIHRRAVTLAPVDTAALANSGNIKPIDKGYSLTFGSERVPYARRRHFENKKNPQTLRYLEKAGESVKRGNWKKYFRGAE